MLAGIRSRLTHAKVMASIAIFIALTAATFGGLALLPGGAFGYIYWTDWDNLEDSSTIARATLHGTNVDKGFVDISQPGPGLLAANSHHFYWTAYLNHFGIGRANLGGSRVDTAFLATEASSIAVGPNHLWWTNDSGIARSNLNGGDLDATFILTDAYFPSGVAADAGHVYWGIPATDAIGRAGVDGNDPDESFITGAGDVAEIAVGAGHIYWTQGDSIGRADLDGDNVDATFIAAGTAPEGIAADGNHIYWVNDCCVGRADLDGVDVDAAFIDDAHGQYYAGIAVDEGPVRTRIDLARVNRQRRKAKFAFSSSHPGSEFQCRLDGRAPKGCDSPKTYERLSNGNHVFKVAATGPGGFKDPTPAKKRFKISRR